MFWDEATQVRSAWRMNALQAMKKNGLHTHVPIIISIGVCSIRFGAHRIQVFCDALALEGLIDIGMLFSEK